MAEVTLEELERLGRILAPLTPEEEAKLEKL